jgi:hypothetical protein
VAVLLVLLVLACDPVLDCDDPRIDCCTNDRQCEAVYEEIAPFCENPGRATGVCVECRDRGDCDRGEECVEEMGFRICHNP